MANGFTSGTYQIPVGSVEFDVSGLSLVSTPTRVQVSVRQPSADGDFIVASPVGAPTSTGFRVVLSAPAPSGAYILDWTAFYGDVSPSPVAGDTLQVTYTDLKNELARFLGYNASSLTEAQASEIDSYIQSGIRNFYYPTVQSGIDPNFEWSFLKMNGTISLSSGTSSYLLPDGFGRLDGQPTFADMDARESVAVITYGDMRELLSKANVPSGRPRFVSVCASNEFGSRGQRKTIYVYPKPDRSYTLNLTGDSDNGRLDATTRSVPLGGPMFSELVIESCLSVAEQKANDEIGLHTQNFYALLASLIQRDRKSGAQSFGKIGGENIW